MNVIEFYGDNRVNRHVIVRNHIIISLNLHACEEKEQPNCPFGSNKELKEKVQKLV